MSSIYVPVVSQDRLGVAYWFRDHRACARFTAQNNSIYPHLPYLMIQLFDVWNGTPKFNPMTYTGDAIIIREDGQLWAVPAITKILEDHCGLLWGCVKLRFMQ